MHNDIEDSVLLKTPDLVDLISLLTENRRKMGKKMSEIIESNPEILGGKPVIKGTRIPVDLIFELLGAETPIEEILEDYPAITKDMIRQLLQIGTDAVKNLQNVNFNSYMEQFS